MRLSPLGALVSMLLLCIGSGDLECSRPLSSVQRRGAQLYGRMCAVCHGRQGEGYAADEAPALSNSDFLSSASDAYLRSAIANGRSNSTMSAWSVARGGPLTLPDLDAIIAFLRSWQRRPTQVLDERPVSGDPGRGADIFAHECARCHGPRGTAGPSVRVGEADLLASASNGFLRQALREGRRGTTMPAFGQRLGEAGVEDVVALLRHWQSSAPPSMPGLYPATIPLGPVVLHPQGPEPAGFRPFPAMTPADVIKGELERGARFGLLDARVPSDYVANHIAGAVSVPFYEPDPRLPGVAKTAWLVCYCACPHAESGALAQRLEAKGFRNVTVLDEGFTVWQARKYPTRSGVDP